MLQKLKVGGFQTVEDYQQKKEATDQSRIVRTEKNKKYIHI